jgi:hypothetical protein
VAAVAVAWLLLAQVTNAVDHWTEHLGPEYRER